MNLNGELHQEYKAAYEPSGDVVWSACGKESIMSVKVESRFETRSGTISGSILTDGINVQIQWQKC